MTVSVLFVFEYTFLSLFCLTSVKTSAQGYLYNDLSRNQLEICSQLNTQIGM